MGDPSNVVSQDLEIKEGMMDELEKWLQSEEGYYARHLSICKNNLEADLNELKIIQYWYDDFLDFLDKLAKYVNGYITLSADGWEEYSEIVFNEGKVNIKLKYGKWKDHTTDDLRNSKKRMKNDTLNKG